MLSSDIFAHSPVDASYPVAPELALRAFTNAHSREGRVGNPFSLTAKFSGKTASIYRQ
jgi:hypothetical protein